jgi:hypothetical protein
MPRRARVDLVAIASVSWFGVAAVADLAALGMPSSTVARRTNPAPTGRLLVLVDERRQRTSSAFVVVERTERLPRPVDVGGLPFAPLDRAVLDTVRRLDRRDAVRAVLAEVVQKGRTTVARLRAELAAGSQRGSALPRQVLDELDAGVRSVAEAWARELHRDSDLPPVLWNPRLYDATGTFIARPDAYFADVGLAWETDSVAHHLALADWDETLRRRADAGVRADRRAHPPAAYATGEGRRRRGAVGPVPARGVATVPRPPHRPRVLTPGVSAPRTGTSRA